MNKQPEDSNEPGGSPGIPLAGQQPVGCQPSLEELYNYMDGYMDEQRQAAVRTHLSKCGGCEEFYQVLSGRSRFDARPSCPGQGDDQWMPYTVGHDLRSGMALVARVLPGNRRSARRRRPPRRLPGEGPEPPVSPQALIRAPKRGGNAAPCALAGPVRTKRKSGTA